MQNINEILVIIDANVTQQKALNRALKLAQITGAKITALLVVYDFSYEITTLLSRNESEMMKASVIEDSKAHLNDIIALQKTSQKIDIIVEWHSRLFDVIIQRILSHSYDVVIKSTNHHNLLQSVIFTPTDLNLIRKCPIPVLLVQEHDWPEQGKVIAAIKATSEVAHHINLNHKIIDTAEFISGLLQSETKLLTCAPDTPLNMSVEIPEFDLIEFRQSIKTHHIKAINEYANKHSIPMDDCIVADGLPEDGISTIAAELDAELIVMGTVGHAGLSALLIGNTAEHLLDSVTCDVLAIKPENFQCPIKLES